MQPLPHENLSQILLSLPYEEILDKCRTPSQFNNICQDQYFWSLKLKRDFPLALRDRQLTARQQYELLYKQDPCWIGNINGFVFSDCVDKTIQQGNLARLKQYLQQQTKIDPDYVYDLVRKAIKYHQWNIVQYFIPLLALKSVLIINNLYDIGIELAQQGQSNLAKMALARAINENVRLAYDWDPRPKVIAALAQIGNNDILDWYINQITHNPKANIRRENFYDTYNVVAENTPILDYLKQFITRHGMSLYFDKYVEIYLLSQIKQGHFEVIDQIKRLYPNVYNQSIDAINYMVTDTLAKEFIDMIGDGKIDQVRLFIQQHPDVIPYAIDSNYMYNLSNSFYNYTVNESNNQTVQRVNLAVNAIEILFDLYPPPKNLVDRFVKNILETNSRSIDESILIDKGIDLFIKYGYNDYNKIVKDSMRRTPYFALKYANQIPSSLLFEAGCYWVNLNMIDQSLAEQPGPDTESINEGVSLVFSNFYGKPQPQPISLAVLIKFMQNLLQYLDKYGLDIDFGPKDLASMITWIISFESIPDDYKIQLLNLIFGSKIFKSLSNDVVVDWTEYYPKTISQAIMQSLTQQNVKVEF